MGSKQRLVHRTDRQAGTWQKQMQNGWQQRVTCYLQSSTYVEGLWEEQLWSRATPLSLCRPRQVLWVCDTMSMRHPEHVRDQPENHVCGREAGLVLGDKRIWGGGGGNRVTNGQSWVLHGGGQGKINLMFKRSLEFQCFNLVSFTCFTEAITSLKTKGKTPLSGHQKQRN